jgi:hypothetical protein
MYVSHCYKLIVIEQEFGEKTPTPYPLLDNTVQEGLSLPHIQ